MAPEIIDGGDNGGHSYEVDIWSIGVMMYVSSMSMMMMTAQVHSSVW